VPGRQGAHGPFDATARNRSLQLYARTHPLLLSGLAAASGLAIAATTRRR
jgi:hypothetical protein